MGNSSSVSNNVHNGSSNTQPYVEANSILHRPVTGEDKSNTKITIPETELSPMNHEPIEIASRPIRLSLVENSIEYIKYIQHQISRLSPSAVNKLLFNIPAVSSEQTTYIFRVDENDIKMTTDKTQITYDLFEIVDGGFGGAVKYRNVPILINCRYSIWAGTIEHLETSMKLPYMCLLIWDIQYKKLYMFDPLVSTDEQSNDYSEVCLAALASKFNNVYIVDVQNNYPRSKSYANAVIDCIVLWMSIQETSKTIVGELVVEQAMIETFCDIDAKREECVKFLIENHLKLFEDCNYIVSKPVDPWKVPLMTRDLDVDQISDTRVTIAKVEPIHNLIDFNDCMQVIGSTDIPEEFSINISLKSIDEVEEEDTLEFALKQWD